MESYQAETIDEIECPICETINRITPEMRAKRLRCGVCKVEFPAAELPPFEFPHPPSPNEFGAIEADQGWVYVISNKSMPGLVKVGYTTKSPKRRARELNNTGNPHRYVVEYDALVPSPRILELSVHRRLASMREGREWFRCSAETATAAIRECGKGTIIREMIHAVKRTGQDQHEDAAQTVTRSDEETRRRKTVCRDALEHHKKTCRVHSVLCASCGATNRVDLERISGTTIDLLCGVCKSSLWK